MDEILKTLTYGWNISIVRLICNNFRTANLPVTFPNYSIYFTRHFWCLVHMVTE